MTPEAADCAIAVIGHGRSDSFPDVESRSGQVHGVNIPPFLGCRWFCSSLTLLRVPAVGQNINSYQNGTSKPLCDSPPGIEQHRPVGSPAGDGRICGVLQESTMWPCDSSAAGDSGCDWIEGADSDGLLEYGWPVDYERGGGFLEQTIRTSMVSTRSLSGLFRCVMLTDTLVF